MAESFFVSILYSKKGMPRPSDELLRQAEAEAFVKLTTPPKKKAPELVFCQQWADVSETLPLHTDVVLSRKTFAKQLLRTVQEVFGECPKMTEEEWREPFFPSTSANYINSRSKGGAAGVMLSDDSLLDHLRTPVITGPVRSDGKLEFEEEVMVKVLETGRTLHMGATDVRLREKWAEVMDRVELRALEEVPVAVPLALPESLKTRVITKGPAFLYTYLKPLQKYLWRHLARHPAFTLTGQQVTARYVQERMGKSLAFGEYLLSVDYSDATNELESWASDLTADAIIQVLGLDEFRALLFKRSLTGHILEDKVSGRQAPQQNGQLMGSITSFPILCLINATVLRWSLEVDRSAVIKLHDARLAVNGDDGLIKCSPDGEAIWSKIASYCGLKPSVGKVYRSRTFCNINSTTYLYSGVLTPFSESTEWVREVRKRGSPPFPGLGEEDYVRHREVTRKWYFKEVQYVNLGLLFGLKRSGGKVSEADVGVETGSLGARARDLLRFCPPQLHERVLSAFIHSHQELLRSSRVPWFLPESLGGLGLPSAGRFCPSNRDRRMARIVLESGTRVPSKPVDAPWQTWKLASQRAIPLTNSLKSHGAFQMLYEWGAGGGENFTSVQRVVGKMCIEQLFLARDIGQLYSEATEATGYLNELRALWKKVIRTPTYPEPLDLEKYNALQVKGLETMNLVSTLAVRP